MRDSAHQIREVEVADLQSEQAAFQSARVKKLLDHRQHALCLIAHSAQDVDLAGSPGLLRPTKQERGICAHHGDGRFQLVRDDAEEFLARLRLSLLTLDISLASS